MHRNEPANEPGTGERPADLFPLPLVPFETYYCLDDCEEYPTTFPVELCFSGRLERERFSAALAAAIARHPLLTALLDRSGRERRWIDAGDRPPAIDWQDYDVPIGPGGSEYLDIATQPGIRTWVRADSNRARVLMQVHHACCDGLAGLQLVRDLLADYKRAGGEDVALRKLDPLLLKQRGVIASDEPRKPSILNGVFDAWYTAKVWASIVFGGPDVLAAPRGRPAVPAAERELLMFESAVLEPEETAGLKQVAHNLGATVNDLLLRDYLLVLRRWNERNGGEGCGRLRINVPVNVRLKADAEMPVANRIGYAFVSEPSGERDPQRLLTIVREETRRIKDWKLGLYFLGGLGFARGMPGLLPWAMRRQRSFATAVLSNVGRFSPQRGLAEGQRWTCGDLVLESVTGVPPTRDLTRAACIVIEYGGRTMCSLRCDPHYFRREDTRALVEEFVAAARETIRRGS